MSEGKIEIEQLRWGVIALMFAISIGLIAFLAFAFKTEGFDFWPLLGLFTIIFVMGAGFGAQIGKWKLIK